MKFVNRKAFVEVLNQLGIKDITVMEIQTEKMTGKKFNLLINPQRRVLKALLEGTQEQQTLALENFRSQVAEIIAKRTVDNDLLENS